MTRQDRTRYVMTKQVNNRVRVKVEDNILKMLLSNFTLALFMLCLDMGVDIA